MKPLINKTFTKENELKNSDESASKTRHPLLVTRYYIINKAKFNKHIS